jgi:hypothetical protein
MLIYNKTKGDDRYMIKQLTVLDLIEKLKELPKDIPVYICDGLYEPNKMYDCNIEVVDDKCYLGVYDYD